MKDTISLLDSQKLITVLSHPFSESETPTSPFPRQKREAIGDKRAIKEILTPNTHRQKILPVLPSRATFPAWIQAS